MFECNVEKDELERMKRRLLRIINEEEDSVRIYRACVKCKSEIAILGLGTVSEDPHLIIV